MGEPCAKSPPTVAGTRALVHCLLEPECNEEALHGVYRVGA